jgi:type II secretion system protein G
MNTRYSILDTRHSNKGFTLIELMVVMVIMAILVVAGVSSFISSQKKSRDTKKKNDLRQMVLALETYYSDHGQYPASDAEGRILGCAPTGTDVCEWGEIFQSEDGGSVYMVNLPVESNERKKYLYVSSGTAFQMYATLENTLDADIPKDQDDQARVFTDIDCGNEATAVYCNYGVSSANTTVESGRTISYE